MRLSSFFLRSLVLALPLAALAVACGDDDDGGGIEPTPTVSDEEALVGYVCLEEDVPETYIPQTDGTLQRADLASLAEEPELRDQELADLGLQFGRLAYWREEPEDPPFENPNHLFCQALLFETADGAQQFFTSMRAEASDLAATAVTILPAEGRWAEEKTGEVDNLPEDARAFILHAGEDAELTVNIVMAQRDRYVLSVFLGGEADTAGPAGAATILEAILARVEPAVSTP